MDDAVTALETALDELKAAQQALSDELADELQDLIDQTAALLSSVREKSAVDGADV